MILTYFNDKKNIPISLCKLYNLVKLNWSGSNVWLKFTEVMSRQDRRRGNKMPTNKKSVSGAETLKFAEKSECQ